MKNIFKTIAFTFVLMFAANTASAQQKKVETAVIKTAIYCDHCKQCESCGDRLNKGLLKTKGVQMVQLDDQAMTITVTYNTKKTDLPTIKSAISQLGYDADDVKATAQGYNELDGCCKKEG